MKVVKQRLYFLQPSFKKLFFGDFFFIKKFSRNENTFFTLRVHLKLLVNPSRQCLQINYCTVISECPILQCNICKIHTTFFVYSNYKLSVYGVTTLFYHSTSDDGKFYPDRGDIVQFSGKAILVLTKEKHNRTTHSLTGVCLENGQPDISSLSSIIYVRIMPELVKKTDYSGTNCKAFGCSSLYR